MSSDRPDSQVCAVLLLRLEDGAALLQHRDDKPGLRRADMWVFPGGHCDCGEPLIDCARREMLEESDYDCRDLRFLTTFTDDAGDGVGYPLSIFWEVYDGVRAYRCLEGQALKFVRRDEAARLKIPANLLQPWDDAIKAMRADRG